MKYYLHLNLQQRASLRIAISLWESKDIQEKTKVFFEMHEISDDLKISFEWHKFTKTVIDGWIRDMLPQHLEVELIHIVRLIGKTIFNWFQYIESEFGKVEAINCIKNIHWTPYGTVDVAQIFKSSWIGNPNLDIRKLYTFACSHMLEEHIDDLRHKLLQNESVDDVLNPYKKSQRHTLAYWEHIRNDDLRNFEIFTQAVAIDFNKRGQKGYNLYYNMDSIERGMLWLSVFRGYAAATKYFWEKITEEEKNDCLLKSARIIAMRFYFFKDDNERISDYKKSQYVEIFIFLINKMTNEQKRAFFNEKLISPSSNTFYKYERNVTDVILILLLFTWPWEELFMPVLEDMLLYQDESSQMVCEFLDKVTKKMSTDHHYLNYPLEMSKYRSLFREAWFIIPAFVKRNIGQHHYLFSFVDSLIKAWDLDSLKLILDDPAIATSRDNFIESGSESYKKLITNDQFEKLDQFIAVFLISEEEKKEFKQNIDIFWDLIRKDRFDLVDKVLDWSCSTPEEKQSVKSNIDHTSIFEAVIDMCNQNDDYGVLNKFLDWKFDTEEEKRNCKNCFKDYGFLIPQIVHIWFKYKKDLETARKKSFLFLLWLFESDAEVVSFKRKIIAEFENDYSMMRHVVALRSNEIMSDFVEWCLNDEEKIQQMKHS